jgi:guanosine-3',5'-bis(diphosphate) 3'-pyrophosphohydrolase
MSGQSRLALFEQRIADLGQDHTLRALDFVVNEMTAEKGFARHDGSDYYHHCVDVAQDILNHNIRDESTLSAALLHDAPEDIPGVTFKMIEDKWNSEIAQTVQLVTKLPGVNYKEGDNIKTLYLDEIIKFWRPTVVKIGDRKHNFSTLRDATAEKKLRQAIETETYFFPFFKEAMKRYPRYSAYFLSAKTAIKPHLLAIKDHHAEMQELQNKYDILVGDYNELADRYDTFRNQF